jgi:hypothetical protein
MTRFSKYKKSHFVIFVPAFAARLFLSDALRQSKKNKIGSQRCVGFLLAWRGLGIAKLYAIRSRRPDR